MPPEPCEPVADAVPEIVQQQLGIKGLLENPLETGMAGMANEIPGVILFVAETQNPHVLFREAS
jgi:hypothetical protein